MMAERNEKEGVKNWRRRLLSTLIDLLVACRGRDNGLPHEVQPAHQTVTPLSGRCDSGVQI